MHANITVSRQAYYCSECEVLKCPGSKDKIRNSTSTTIAIKFFSMHSLLLSNVTAMLHMFLPTMHTKLPMRWIQSFRLIPSPQAKTKPAVGSISCPYEYILDVYGNNHFKNIVQLLDPTLEQRDPIWFNLILEIMDTIHFGAILVDDVTDNSILRKGKTAAHRIYGSSETVNRAYLRIFQIIEKCRSIKPSAVPFVMDSLTQIHKGSSPIAPMVII